jgi:hypothetical protein
MLLKYPRTLHVPWSNWTNDDKVNETMAHFNNRHVVVTEKLDGENWTVYNTDQHARSLDSEFQSYQSILYSRIAQFQYNIPEGWRICGEYMYAKHSIHYTDLKDWLYVTSIWNESNYCFPFNVTQALCKVFRLPTPNVIYIGVYNKDIIQEHFNHYTMNLNRECEGYVIRLYTEFHFDDFHKFVAKYVRANHVQTDEHWKYSKIDYNSLRQK